MDQNVCPSCNNTGYVPDPPDNVAACCDEFHFRNETAEPADEANWARQTIDASTARGDGPDVAGQMEWQDIRSIRS
jgi:hypothetical protein